MNKKRFSIIWKERHDIDESFLGRKVEGEVSCVFQQSQRERNKKKAKKRLKMFSIIC